MTLWSRIHESKLNIKWRQRKLKIHFNILRFSFIFKGDKNDFESLAVDFFSHPKFYPLSCCFRFLKDDNFVAAKYMLHEQNGISNSASDLQLPTYTVLLEHS